MYLYIILYCMWTPQKNFLKSIGNIFYFTSGCCGMNKILNFRHVRPTPSKCTSDTEDIQKNLVQLKWKWKIFYMQ